VPLAAELFDRSEAQFLIRYMDRRPDRAVIVEAA
jgi:hypothetical protein